jgi:hypothetical protein
MISMTFLTAAFLAQAQKTPGRVEVEGLVISAVARPSRFGSLSPSQADEFELEFTIEPKAANARLTTQIGNDVRAMDAEGKAVSAPSRFNAGMPPRSAGANRWSVGVKISPKPTDKLHAVEGTVLYSPTKPRSAVFAGATLKPNSTVTIEGGKVKLTVLDFDDGRPDVRLRATMTGDGREPSVVRGARAAFVSADGKETPLNSSGGGFSGGAKSIDHHLRFGSNETVEASSLRMLRVEIPLPSAEFKTAKFRMTDVPVQPFDPRRGMEP